MSCAAINSRRRRGAFTLLEVMIAVMIVSLLMVSVYRFVRATLVAIRTSQAMSNQRQELAALIDYIRGELEDLPARAQGALLGNPGRYHDAASDEMQWICRAGYGVLTTSAPDEYRVTLAIQPVAQSSSELEIGLRRQPTNLDEKNYHWLPLLRPAAALEIRYYDSRLNAWIDRWSDNSIRPTLVRVRVWRTADEPPLEAVMPVPSARSQGALQ
jgi:prepilin-type N-terminal cleavage/methylation domain-containing protein